MGYASARESSRIDAMDLQGNERRATRVQRLAKILRPEPNREAR